MLKSHNLEEEFIQKINEHQSLIRKICSLYASDAQDREDSFQEIVLQLWKAYPRFQGNAKFSTWLYRIAINTIVTGLRKKRPTLSLMGDEPPPERHVVGSGSDTMRDDLYQAIGQLNETEKAIVMLYLEDLSYSDMKDVLGISENALKVRMSRIKEKLRQITKKN